MGEPERTAATTCAPPPPSPPGTPAPRPGRLGRIARAAFGGDGVLAAFGGALLLYFVLTPGMFQGKLSGDGLIDFLYLPSVFVHGTLDMSKAHRENKAGWGLPRIRGKMANEKPIGPPLMWAPFYGVGVGLEAVARANGGLRGQPVGSSSVVYWMVGCGTLVWGFVGLRVLYALLRRRFGRGAARFGVAGAVFGTALLWYLTMQPSYQHGLAFVTVVLLVERWDAWRSRLTAWRCAALGALGGLAVLVRAQEVTFLLLPAADVAIGLARAVHARWTGRDTGAGTPAAWLGRGLALGAGALLVAGLQPLCWLIAFGTLLPPLARDGYMRWTYPELVGTLFALRGGLLAWHPIVYLAFAGVVLSVRRLGALGLGLLVMFGLQLYIDACPRDWWGEWGYGCRRLCDLTVLFGVGLAALYARLGPRGRVATLAAAALLVAWNVAGIETLRHARMPSSGTRAMGAWEWLETAGAPQAAAALVKRTGWPFAWPASVPFALAHGTHPRVYEETAGAYVNQERTFYLNLAHPEYRRLHVRGLTVERGRVLVAGTAQRPARLLVPLFWRGAIRLDVKGRFPAGELRLRWNGRFVPLERTAAMIRGLVPGDRTRFGVNEIELWGPPGTELTYLYVTAPR
ncbi:MAG TPA: hypothetical protein VGQ83_07900 [Polyangia bacterium]|jgi:hypothetical protein